MDFQIQQFEFINIIAIFNPSLLQAGESVRISLSCSSNPLATSLDYMTITTINTISHGLQHLF
uniref:Uncharacterized protein n=1 Tax=Lepeophtheirus salmonis TaxID=72036 RepID=A0A0K2UD16_LEPSM